MGMMQKGSELNWYLNDPIYNDLNVKYRSTVKYAMSFICRSFTMYGKSDSTSMTCEMRAVST